MWGRGLNGKWKRGKGRGRDPGKREKGIGNWILGLDLTWHPNRARARTHDTNRFPGWTHAPTSYFGRAEIGVVVDAFLRDLFGLIGGMGGGGGGGDPGASAGPPPMN